jgi:hypothetical protein
LRPLLVLLAAAAALFALHRVAVWMEDRGWIYYRRRRGSSGALGDAFLEVQSLVDPAQKAVLEARRLEDDEAAESGDPPEPGSSPEPPP